MTKNEFLSIVSQLSFCLSIRNLDTLWSFLFLAQVVLSYSSGSGYLLSPLASHFPPHHPPAANFICLFPIWLSGLSLGLLPPGSIYRSPPEIKIGIHPIASVLPPVIKQAHQSPQTLFFDRQPSMMALKPGCLGVSRLHHALATWLWSKRLSLLIYRNLTGVLKVACT